MSDTEIGTKRSNGDISHDSDNKRSRSDGLQMRFLVAGNQCGSIIGKGGENIKRLQNDFGVKLHLPNAQCRERVLSMQGDKESCVSVLRELLPSFKDALYTVDPKYKPTFEINFLASTESVGAVIGKGAEKIKEIREQSGGKVKVYQDCLPDSTERVIAIGGEDESNVLSAFNIVIDLLEGRPPNRQVRFFNPKNQGGFNDRDQNRNSVPDRRPPTGAPSQMGGPMNPMNSTNPLGALAGLGGLSGLAGANILAQLGVNPQVSAALLGGASGNNMAAMLGNNSNLGPRGGNLPEQDFDRNNRNGVRDERFANDRRDNKKEGNDNEKDFSLLKSEVTLTVPYDMCGAIIGRSGQTIKEIKHQSGARLDFSKTEKNSREDRVLTISGTQQQTITAQRMIADVVMNRES